MVNTPIQYIGKFTKPYGYKGELALRFDVSIPQEFQQTEWVFVTLDGLPVPFFISSTENIWIKDEQTAILKLNDIDSDIQAKELVNKDVSISQFQSEKSWEPDNFNAFKGFKITDKNLGEIGIFEKIIEIPQNPLMQVFQNQTEILIPLSDDIVTEINTRQKNIQVIVPNGLLDIFL